MKTVNIKGKNYIEVVERVKHFRNTDKYKDWSIITTMLSNDNGMCVFKASILDEHQNIRSIGHAYEKEGSSFINKTSYIENCETSAVGRALGILGIGIDTDICSADEVIQVEQYITEDQVSELDALVKQTETDAAKLLAFANAQTYQEITQEQYKNIIVQLKNKLKG